MILSYAIWIPIVFGLIILIYGSERPSAGVRYLALFGAILGFMDLWLHRLVQHARAFDHSPGPVGFGLWFVFDRHSGHHVPQLGAVVGQ